MNLVKCNDRKWTENYPVTMFSSWLNEFFNNDFFASEKTALPSVNVKEKSDKVIFEVAMPGVSQDDIKLSVEEDRLCIRAEQKLENKKKEDDYWHREFYCGSFQRSFPLSENLNSEKIEAKLKNGVLEVIIPKLKGDIPRARIIQIK